MEKIFNIIPSVGETFVCWFILQHLRGYKPFINKISFERSFRENFSIGKDHREEEREKKEKRRRKIETNRKKKNR